MKRPASFLRSDSRSGVSHVYGRCSGSALGGSNSAGRPRRSGRLKVQAEPPSPSRDQPVDVAKPVAHRVTPETRPPQIRVDFDGMPLPLDVAAVLRKYLDGKPGDVFVWPGSRKDTAAELFRKDLADARGRWLQSCRDVRQRDEIDAREFLTYRDRDGRVTDFHASRHTDVSRIRPGGATAKVAQHLVRY